MQEWEEQKTREVKECIGGIFGYTEIPLKKRSSQMKRFRLRRRTQSKQQINYSISIEIWQVNLKVIYGMLLFEAEL